MTTQLVQKRRQNNIKDVVMLSLLLTLNRFTNCFDVIIVDFQQVNASVFNISFKRMY